MQQNGRQQGLHHGRQRGNKRHLQTVSAGAPPGLQQLARDQAQPSAPGNKQARMSPEAARQLPPGFTGQSAASLQQVRTSSTTRAHLTDVHFSNLAICEPTKR